MTKMIVLDQEVALQSIADTDYICITDIAKFKSSDRTDDLSVIGCGIAIRLNFWYLGKLK